MWICAINVAFQRMNKLKSEKQEVQSTMSSHLLWFIYYNLSSESPNNIWQRPCHTCWLLCMIPLKFDTWLPMDQPRNCWACQPFCLLSCCIFRRTCVPGFRYLIEFQIYNAYDYLLYIYLGIIVFLLSLLVPLVCHVWHLLKSENLFIV